MDKELQTKDPEKDQIIVCAFNQAQGVFFMTYHDFPTMKIKDSAFYEKGVK